MGNACACDRGPNQNEEEIDLFKARSLRKGHSSLRTLPGTYEFPQKYSSLLSKIPKQEIPENYQKTFDKSYYQTPFDIIYQGTWDSEGRASGYGTLLYLNHGIYMGYLEDFEPKGEGYFIGENEDLFYGKFDGVKKCEGILRMNDGTEVKGKFVDGSIEGYGSEKWVDGTTFEGNYLHGQKTGQGKMTWYNNETGKITETYEGEFKDNNFHGKGVYKWSTKKTYSGEWADGKMNGEGEFTWKDGRVYKGGFKDDLKDGYGEFKWIDGRCWKGFWANGEKHGFGLSVDSSGLEKIGEWENDKRKKWIEGEEAVTIKKTLRQKAIEKMIL